MQNPDGCEGGQASQGYGPAFKASGCGLWVSRLRGQVFGEQRRLKDRRHEVAEEQEKTLKPLRLKGFLLVEHRRFELLTPTLPVLCATNCANAPRFSESYHSIFPISCKALFAFFCDVFLTFSDGSAVLSPCMFSQHQVV